MYSDFDAGVLQSDYKLGFRHGREYERKHGKCEDNRINPVMHKIRKLCREHTESTGRPPTRVYLGTSEMACVKYEVEHRPARWIEHPLRLMGLDLHEVKDQFHCRVA